MVSCKSTAEEVSFVMNGHIIGFCRQTQKLELNYMSELTLGVKELRWLMAFIWSEASK